VHSRASMRLGRRTVAVARFGVRLMGALLAAILVTVASLWLLAGTPSGRELLAYQLERMLARDGIRATFRARWDLPLRLVLEDVRVPSLDGGPPTFEAPRVVVVPRLAWGRLEAWSIDYEAPILRVVHSSSEHAPAQDAWTRARQVLTGRWRVRALVVRDGRVEIAWGRVHVAAGGIHVEAHAREDSGGVLHIAIADGRVQDPVGEGGPHEDAFCALSAEGSAGAHGFQVDHLEARAVPNIENAGTDCALFEARAGVVVQADHAFVALDPAGNFSMARGHVRVRVPLSVLERAARLTRVRGWASVDGDVQFVAGDRLPRARGTAEAHEVSFDEFRVARTIDARFTLDGEVLRIPSAAVDTTSGKMRVTEIELRPLAPGVPARGRVFGGGLRFEEFLRAIKVARHPHVRWSIETLRWDGVEGTLSPLSLSGDLAAHTGGFAVSDAACDIERCERIWSFARSTIAARASLTSQGFAMDDVRATLTGGDVQAAHVLIGFHDQLSVEGGRARLDLGHASPLASLSIAGRMNAGARVFGRLGDPVVDFSGTVDGFVLGGDPLGDVTSVRGRYHATTLRFDAVSATKGRSQYQVPSLRIEFGDDGQLDVDAIVRAREVAVYDLLSLVHLEGRLSMLGGSLGDARARVRFVHKGPEDELGLGTIFVSADAGLVRPSAFGEHFDRGTLGVDVRWWDHDAGLAGVDIDLRSLEVRDGGSGRPAQQGGSLVASGQLTRGTIRASAVAAALPVSRVFASPKVGGSIGGWISGVAQASGTIEALEASTDVEVSPLRVGNVHFGPSSVHVEAALGTLVPMRVSASGSLLGGQVSVAELLASGREIRGSASLHALRVDPWLTAARALPSSAQGDRPSAPAAVEASLSGELTVDALDPMDVSRARARFVPTAFRASLGAESARLRPTGAAITLADDAIVVPPMRIDIELPQQRVAQVPTGPPTPGVVPSPATPRERIVRATVGGSVGALAQHPPHIDIDVDVAHADLALLVGVVPDLATAEGTLAGALTIKGPLDAPMFHGALRAHADAASFTWIPSELRDVNVDVSVDRHELRIARASARLGDGLVDVTGESTITGLLPGVAHLAVRARGVHLAIARGIDAAFDADVSVLADVRRLLRGDPHTVVVTGDAALDDLVYRRPLETASSSAVDKAGEFDPSRDLVDLAILLRLRAPAQLEDDVATLRFASPGEFWLRGTNQRPSLDGRLVALGGGKLHVRGISFDVSHATLDFADPLAVNPRVDLVATTDYHRLSAFEPPASFASYGARGARAWRIQLRALGSDGDIRVELTSDPPLSQTDIVLLLTLGMTRPELDAMQATAQLQTSAGLEVLAGLGGAQRLVRDVVPIDEVRFGGTYSPQTLVIVPDVTVGKRIGERLAATVTSSLAYQRIVGGTVSWWLGSNVWFETLWENVAPVPVYPVGNFGVGLRWRLDL
jgi:translocation and assembly module TamB